jgi:F0F1-type ATP synthase membrane subunit b/b'
MSYLKSKDGSIEASIKEMQKNLKDNAYQKLFKKELEKAGKGIGSMSDQEKKDFFNNIDKKYKGKNEDLDSKDEPSVKDVANQLKKAVKAHGQQAKDLEKAIKSEASVPAGPDTDQMHDYKKAKSKDPKAGEKEPMKMNTEEESFDIEKLKEDVNTLWSNAAKDLEEMKKNSKYMKAQDVAPDSDTDSEKDEKKGKTLVGSKQTKVETEPKVDYVK